MASDFELNLSVVEPQPPRSVLEWLGLGVGSVRWESLDHAGGFSGARFWRGEVCGAVGTFGGQSLCLRAWPAEHPDDTRLTWIHQRLAQASQLKFIPVPRLGIDGRSWLAAEGRRWECTPWMPGSAIESLPLSLAANVERLRQAFGAVAQLHRAWQWVPQTVGVVPAIQDRRQAIDRLLSTDLVRLVQAHANERLLPLHCSGTLALRLLPRFLAEADQIVARWEKIPLPLQPCVRDLWSAHLLFVGQGVGGIVDFGAMRVDSVATDLGRLAGSYVEDDEAGWQIAAEAYGDENGEMKETWELARDLEKTGLGLGIANWLRWLWLEKREFGEMQRVEERFVTRVERLARLQGTVPLR